MSKNKKILLILIVAILLSVAAAYCTITFLSPQRVKIYVFNANYSAGEQITGSMFTPVEVDRNVVVNGTHSTVNGTFVTSEDYRSVVSTGESLRIDVAPGTPLMYSMLSSRGNRIEVSMRSDAIGVTVAVDNITGVTADLEAGSRVNIYSSESGEGLITKLILQNMRILAVERSGGELSSVTIECDNTQAMQLINAYNYGKIHLGIVDSTGYQYIEGIPSYTR